MTAEPPLEARVREATSLLQDVATTASPAAFACSFGLEDMVLLDLIARLGVDIEPFVLDTGRLPGETYALIDRARERYAVRFRIYYPDAAAIEHFVHENGVNAFYRSVALREACCAIRKQAPLARALEGKRAWVTGLRRTQSVTRSDVAARELDRAHGILKFNPLVDWSLDDVWAYVRAHRVPYNALHDRGYPSIGCAPCTRAVEEGEDIRAGRWWWEQPEHRECGLHRRPLDIAVRVAETVA